MMPDVPKFLHQVVGLAGLANGDEGFALFVVVVGSVTVTNCLFAIDVVPHFPAMPFVPTNDLDGFTDHLF